MAVQPTLKVEIAFVSDPLTLAPTWVDVSQYVRQSPGVSIRRGRQKELDNFDAGSCHITLSNRDRRFDPSYAAGPNFGNLLPRKQIRVSATWAATDYVMFQGWVTGWPQSLAAPGGKDSTVTIEAVDALAWLSNNRVPTDLVYTYANTTIGSLAFLLRNADTSQWSDATSLGYFATPYTGTAQTSSSLAAGSPSPSVTFDHNTVWTMPQAFASAGAWSVSFWIKTTDTSGSTDILGGGGSSGAGAYTQMTLGSTGTIVLSNVTAASTGTIYGTTSAIRLNDGLPHHVVFTSDNTSSANARAYIDGVDRTNTPSGTVQSPLMVSVLGCSTVPAAAANTFSGSLQDVAVFNKQLSAAEVLGLYQRSNGYLAETTTARVTRILDDVGWPATWRTLTTTSRGTVGRLVYNAATANSLLQEVQRGEQGRIFAGKTNFVTFLERYYVQEQSAGLTVQQIFADDGGATAIPYSTFGFQFNDVDVTNDATVTTPTTYAASSDTTSKTAYGLQSQKVDTNLSTFDQAQSMAKGLVARGKTGTYRLSPIMAHPANNSTRWPNVLGLELGQRVSFKITPMAVGASNTQEVSVESIEWLVESNLWSLVIAGEPVRDVWFIVDGATSPVDGTRVIGY